MIASGSTEPRCVSYFTRQPLCHLSTLLSFVPEKLLVPLWSDGVAEIFTDDEETLIVVLEGDDDDDESLTS